LARGRVILLGFRFRIPVVSGTCVRTIDAMTQLPDTTSDDDDGRTRKTPLLRLMIFQHQCAYKL
jgi:hypothetical protein